MKTPSQVYSTYVEGQPLTDAELKSGAKHFTEMADALMKSGPVFRLAGIEARQVGDALKEYIYARKRASTKPNSYII